MTLRIRLFGDLQIQRENEPLPPFSSRDAEGLFCFLVLHNGQTFCREVLAGKLFPDCSNGTKRIRTAIWRARQVLDQDKNESPIHTENRRLGLQLQESDWVDVEEFESVLSNYLAQRTPNVKQAHELIRAIDLYRADLLEERDDDWCFCIRERLKLRMLMAAESVMAFFADTRDWNKAINHAHLLLQHDPLREHVHRELMRFYYQVGDRPAAIAQYNHCAELLGQELGIQPMQETQLLRTQIMSESIPRLTNHPPTEISQSRLERILACLDEARTHLLGQH